jgi:hypothetical protein
MTSSRMDDLLMIVVMCGVAMTCSYIAAECLSWRSLQASDLKARLVVRDLYKRLHMAAIPLVRAVRKK